MFFCTSTQSLEKRQSMMPLFEFPQHVPEKLLACFMTSYDEPWRTRAGNRRLNNRFFASHWRGYLC